MNIVRRSGIRLAYIESGGGPKSMLLVHGCGHTALAPQTEYFCNSYRVIPVDLTGHGASDMPHQEYSVEGFADDLAYPCDELRLRRPVVVGTVWAELFRSSLPPVADLISAAILIDSVILTLAVFVEALRPFADALRGDEYREAIRETVSRVCASPGEEDSG